MFLIRDHDLRKDDYATARARYAKAFPQLFVKELATFTDRDAFAAIDLALVLQHTGEDERAKALLDRSEAYMRTFPRMGPLGYGCKTLRSSVARGNHKGPRKLARGRAGRLARRWRYDRDCNPNFDSIRNEPEFKAIFADIERDMAQQRAQLAARPKDAPLELSATAP